MRIFVVIFLFLEVSLAYAVHYQPMDGGPFPVVDGPGPLETSADYTLELPVTLHIAKTDVELDTPKGALLTVMSEDEALTAMLENTALPIFNYRGLEPPLKNGEVFHLHSMKAGTHKLRVEGFKTSTRVQLLISQPNSPLLMKTFVRPLAIQVGQKSAVFVEFEDEQPIRTAEVSVVLKNYTYPAVQIEDQKYSVSFRAPPVKTRESFPVRVLAQGTRFNGNSFIREKNLRIMVIQPKSGLKKVAALPQGDLKVEVFPANGHFRLEVFYGLKGKTIAFAEENFTLIPENTETTFLIKRPNIALASDQALVKLLNMDTLGLEGQQAYTLVPDKIALRTFQMPVPTIPVLPESKLNARELLEYVTPSPHATNMP